MEWFHTCLKLLSSYVAQLGTKIYFGHAMCFWLRISTSELCNYHSEIENLASIVCGPQLSTFTMLPITFILPYVFLVLFLTYVLSLQ